MKPSNALAFSILRGRNTPDSFFSRSISPQGITDNMIEEAFDVLLMRGQLIPCGACGSYHPKNFIGDCRDDFNRF